ncbi:MAG: saccharopine dehydrogenase NADP-binding domain-containing protein [Kiloniellales bacterium]
MNENSTQGFTLDTAGSAPKLGHEIARAPKPEKRLPIDGRLVVVGCGTIGQCILPMLLETFAVTPERISVIEAGDSRGALAGPIDEGLDYRTARLGPDNLAETLGATAKPGDIVINLSVGVDSIDLADWCVAHGVCYLDTAIEPWEDAVNDPSSHIAERTEYALHQRARQAGARWAKDSPTAVFTHGANPGLVSAFVKQALLDLARALRLEIARPRDRDGWARLAMATGTRVIHISERDSQSSDRPRRPGEFVNTWSVPGFVEEAAMPGEIGWGTHERSLPPLANHHESGPRNTIFMAKPGGLIRLRSWVPMGGPIVGLMLPHSECVTISDYLTVCEDGGLLYRPTVAFVYLPCDEALASLHETMMRDWRPQSRERVLNEEIVAGRDELGVLLLGHDLKAWWLGSQLDVHEGRELVPGNNPTAIQVAAGALAACHWVARNRNRGYCEPEDLPHDEVLKVARPYLGPMVSQPSDWTPFKGRQQLFEEPWLDPSDPWQFTNFLVR